MSETYALLMSTDNGETFNQYGTGMTRDDIAKGILSAIDVGNATVKRDDAGTGYKGWENGAGIVWRWTREDYADLASKSLHAEHRIIPDGFTESLGLSSGEGGTGSFGYALPHN